MKSNGITYVYESISYWSCLKRKFPARIHQKSTIKFNVINGFMVQFSHNRLFYEANHVSNKICMSR